MVMLDPVVLLSWDYEGSNNNCLCRSGHLAVTHLSRGSSLLLLFILCCAFGPPPSRAVARSVSNWCTRAFIAAARSRNSGEVVETVEVNGGIIVLSLRILVNVGGRHPVRGVPPTRLSRCFRIMWDGSK